MYWLNISGNNICTYKAPSNYSEWFVSSKDAICCQERRLFLICEACVACQVLSKKGWLILSCDRAALNAAMDTGAVTWGGELQKQPLQVKWM